MQQGNSEVEKSSAGDATASQQGSGETGQPQVSPPGQGGNGSVDSEEIRAMRKKFFQLLYSHIVHKTDVTVFEDTCRSMLGANSFVLFTIQKLVLKLARHLASVIAVRSPSVWFTITRSGQLCMQSLGQYALSLVHYSQSTFHSVQEIPIDCTHAGRFFCKIDQLASL